jgi:anti-anti-sigma regulatory factor
MRLDLGGTPDTAARTAVRGGPVGRKPPRRREPRHADWAHTTAAALVPDGAPSGSPGDSAAARIDHAIAALDLPGATTVERAAEALVERLTNDPHAARRVTPLVIALQAGLTRALDDALRAVAAPVIGLRQRVLFVPVERLADAAHARELADRVLRAIASHRANRVILHLAGHDGHGARERERAGEHDVVFHLIPMAKAARLLGATIILTGISPAGARRLAMTDIDHANLRVVDDPYATLGQCR